MRRTLLTVGLLTVAVAGNTGCSTMNNTEKGVGLGGALGAGVGTIIGGATGNPKTGALAGALIGGATGGIIGNDMDKKEAREATARHDQAVQQYADAQPQRLAEVVELSKKQSEQVVLNHIRANNMRFHLSVADLDYLKSNGVADRVIAEMQTGGSPTVTRVSTVAPPARTVVVREQVLVPTYDPFWGPPPVIVAPRPVYGAHFHFRR